jgi:hypothetical protein
VGDAITVKGVEQVQKNLDEAKQRYVANLHNALYRLGVEIARSAQMKAPSVTGSLRESAYATRPDNNGSVEVGFGAPYAAKEHEDLELAHRHGGEGKFLQNAMSEALASGLSKLAQWTNAGGSASSQGIAERPKFNDSKHHGVAQVLESASKK